MKTSQQNLINTRYSSIDFIKGISILFVIITHYAWQDTERRNLLFPLWIDMAVPIFMIVSGFVHTRSYQKSNIDTIDKAYTVGSIARKVFKYTFPFVIAFLIGEIMFALFDSSRRTFWETIFLFLCGGAGPGGYYYPIMMQFIFFFPVIYAIVRKYDFKGLVVCGVINFLYELLKSAYGMTEGFYRLVIFRYTLLIAYGCYLGMGNYIRHKLYSVLCSVLGALYIVVTKYFNVVPPITNYWTGTSLWACLFIIPLAKPIILNKCHNCVIESLGRASYHIFLVQMIYYSGASMIYNLIPNRYMQLVVNVVVCVVGGLLFFYIETCVSKKILKKLSALWCTYQKARNTS